MERTNPDLIRAFARVLKRRRKAAGMSQEDLAFRANLSMSYVSLLETMRRQPTLTALHALSQELGVSLAELMAEVEADLPKS